MSTLNTISIDKLVRLIGTPACPSLIDVQTDEDFAAAPRLVPSAVRRPWAKAGDWAPEFDGRSAVVICQKGLKLSQGVAAWLLNGPLTAALVALALVQLATWAPHYLTWPWFADHDVFELANFNRQAGATMASLGRSGG